MAITPKDGASELKLTDFDALSFDCYGTLIDWEAGLRVGLAEIASLSRDVVDVNRLLETYAACESETERSRPELLYSDVIAHSAVATGAIWGIDVPGALAAKMGASVPAWPAFPDSAAALTKLKKHFKMIILSNMDRASFAGSNTRLGVEFDAILTAEDIGSYKPSAQNFDVLIAKTTEMDIKPGRLLHVAQSLFHDHVPAKAAGLKTVWIDRRFDQEGFGGTPPPASTVTPDWTFASMRAFAEAVDAAG